MRLRHSAGCLDEHDIVKLKPLKRFNVELNVMGQTYRRKMVEVYLEDKKTLESKPWYVDTITGSIYDPKTGKCNSSNISISKIYRA